MVNPSRVQTNSASLFEIAEADWLSTKDVANFLSVTPNAVRIMVCRGFLPKYNLRGRLRFRKKDCVALIQKKGA